MKTLRALLMLKTHWLMQATLLTFGDIGFILIRGIMVVTTLQELIFLAQET